MVFLCSENCLSCTGFSLLFSRSYFSALNFFLLRSQSWPSFQPKFLTVLCWRGKEDVWLFIWHPQNVLRARRSVLVCQSGSGKLAVVPFLSLAWLGRGGWLSTARIISLLDC